METLIKRVVILAQLPKLVNSVKRVTVHCSN